uniref:Uncharacterized protein n=1 Tax=Anguilla anguilla TaxID=7936 RepID=A0A0E9X4K6_ANGAN
MTFISSFFSFFMYCDCGSNQISCYIARSGKVTDVLILSDFSLERSKSCGAYQQENSFSRMFLICLHISMY